MLIMIALVRNFVIDFRHSFTIMFVHSVESFLWGIICIGIYILILQQKYTSAAYRSGEPTAQLPFGVGCNDIRPIDSDSLKRKKNPQQVAKR